MKCSDRVCLHVSKSVIGLGRDSWLLVCKVCGSRWLQVLDVAGDMSDQLVFRMVDVETGKFTGEEHMAGPAKPKGLF